MTLLAVTTIVRAASTDERSSRIYLVDPESRAVAGEVGIPEDPLREFDPNPRGGFRGARGMAAGPDRFAVATSNRIYLFDRDWSVVSEVDHESLGGIHDLCGDPEGIWIASTRSDLLARIDWDGRLIGSWHWAGDERLSSALGFAKPPKFDSRVDYRLPIPGSGAKQSVHLNSVIRTTGGLLLGFGKVRSDRRTIEKARSRLLGALMKVPGARQLVMRISSRRRQAAGDNAIPVPQDGVGTHAIVRVELTENGLIGGAELIHSSPTATPNHNLLEREGAIWFNDSDGGVFRGIDPISGETVGSIAIPGAPSFARGLCELPDGRVAIGSQRPAAVHIASIEEGGVSATIELSSEARETVYAICQVPSGFGVPVGGNQAP